MLHPWQRVEHLPQRLVEVARHVQPAQRQLAALLLDGEQAVAQEDDLAFTLTQRHEGVFEHVLDRGPHAGLQRRGGDIRVQQRGDVLHRHRQVGQYLQHCHRLGHRQVQRLVDMTLAHLADRLVDGVERATDLFFQLVIQRGGGDQRADRLAGQTSASALAAQHVLHDLDGRAQAQAAGGLGQRTQQVQQDVEMRRQEGVELDEAAAVEIGFVEARVFELDVVAQLLAMAVKHGTQAGITVG